MTELNRRNLMAGAACMLGTAGVPAADAFAAPVPDLEDWIGRELLARIDEISRRRPRSLEERNVYMSYVDFRFDDGCRLRVTASFRSSVTGCLQDRLPRLFPIRHYFDLQTFRALLRAEHPAFRGLAGLPGSTVPHPSNDIWLLVAPLEQLARERAKHTEIVHWGRPVCERGLLNSDAYWQAAS
jgi:hypothetical protein